MTLTLPWNESLQQIRHGTEEQSAQPLVLTPAGPVLPDETAQMQTALGTFVPALNAQDTTFMRVLTVMWVMAFAYFWICWFQPEHQIGCKGLSVNSLLLLFDFSYLPMYFLAMGNRLRRINPRLEIPQVRTALLVTKAPSER